jgi:hypothetical protein
MKKTLFNTFSHKGNANENCIGSTHGGANCNLSYWGGKDRRIVI